LRSGALTWGLRLDADYPHARRETVLAAHPAIFEALKTRDPMPSRPHYITSICSE
jgi:hypothetical protein